MLKRIVIVILSAIIAFLLILVIRAQLHEPIAPPLIANPYNTVFDE